MLSLTSKKYLLSVSLYMYIYIYIKERDCNQLSNRASKWLDSVTNEEEPIPIHFFVLFLVFFFSSSPIFPFFLLFPLFPSGWRSSSSSLSPSTISLTLLYQFATCFFLKISSYLPSHLVWGESLNSHKHGLAFQIFPASQSRPFFYRGFFWLL